MLILDKTNQIQHALPSYLPHLLRILRRSTPRHITVRRWPQPTATNRQSPCSPSTTATARHRLVPFGCRCSCRRRCCQRLRPVLHQHRLTSATNCATAVKARRLVAGRSSRRPRISLPRDGHLTFGQQQLYRTAALRPIGKRRRFTGHRRSRCTLLAQPARSHGAAAHEATGRIVRRRSLARAMAVCWPITVLTQVRHRLTDALGVRGSVDFSAVVVVVVRIHLIVVVRVLNLVVHVHIHVVDGITVIDQMAAHRPRPIGDAVQAVLDVGGRQTFRVAAVRPEIARAGRATAERNMAREPWWASKIVF